MRRGWAGSILIAFLLQALASAQSAPPLRSDALEAQVREKCSPDLQLVVAAKRRQQAAGTKARPELLEAFTPHRSVERQHVHLFLKHTPSKSDLASLHSLGAQTSGDSWIPRASDPAKGSLSATVPVSALAAVSALDFVEEIRNAEVFIDFHLDLAAAASGASFALDTLGLDGSGVKVAVIDSGLDAGHPDLKTPVHSQDMTSLLGLGSIENPTDAHGTHVSGIVVGSGLSSGGKFRGIAPGADLLFYKVNFTEADAMSDQIIEALALAAEHGANITNISLGYIGGWMDGTDRLADAIKQHTDAGMAVVCSAGNNAALNLHMTVPSIPAGTGVQSILFTADTPTDELSIAALWMDGLGVTEPVTLEVQDGSGNIITGGWFGPMESVQTGAELYAVTIDTSGFAPNTLLQAVVRTVNTTQPLTVQLYLPKRAPPLARFTTADAGYTLTTPSISRRSINTSESSALISRYPWPSSGPRKPSGETGALPRRSAERRRSFRVWRGCGFNAGCASSKSASAPATTGAAMLVPAFT